MGQETVVIFPDLHLPFVDWKKVFYAIRLLEYIQPDVVIQCGDVLDFYSQARFAKSGCGLTPEQELKEGLEGYKRFWDSVAKATSKRCRRIQLGGNHTDRAIKLAADVAPSLIPFLDVEGKFKLPGLELYMDSRHELEIDGVLYIHGWLSNSFAHAKYFNKPVVHGHLHSAGVFMENMKDGLLWSMSCGYLADPYQTPLLYRSTKTAKWVHGLGVVDSHGPRFIYL